MLCEAQALAQQHPGGQLCVWMCVCVCARVGCAWAGGRAGDAALQSAVPCTPKWLTTPPSLLAWPHTHMVPPTADAGILEAFQAAGIQLPSSSRAASHSTSRAASRAGSRAEGSLRGSMAGSLRGDPSRLSGGSSSAAAGCLGGGRKAGSQAASSAASSQGGSSHGGSRKLSVATVQLGL